MRALRSKEYRSQETEDRMAGGYMGEEKHDGRERRCPRLGGPVTFGYCRSCEAEHLPCRKIADCWWETFDVVSYLRDHFPQDVLQGIEAAQPKPKMNQLLELIAAARKRVDGA